MPRVLIPLRALGGEEVVVDVIAKGLANERTAIVLGPGNGGWRFVSWNKL